MIEITDLELERCRELKFEKKVIETIKCHGYIVKKLRTDGQFTDLWGIYSKRSFPLSKKFEFSYIYDKKFLTIYIDIANESDFYRIIDLCDILFKDIRGLTVKIKKEFC